MLMITDPVIAQDRYRESTMDHLFLEGEGQYKSGHFLSARKSFEAYLNQQKSDRYSVQSSFYIGLIDLDNFRDPQRLQLFAEEHGNSPSAMEARLALADYFFEKKAFDRCIPYYEALPLDLKAIKRRSEIRYRLAYAYFVIGQREKAAAIFGEVIHYQGSERYKAHYYAGVIEHDIGSQPQALDHLLSAEGDPGMINLTAPLVTQIYTDQENYGEVIRYAEERLERVNREEEIKLLVYIGEAYFAMSNYEAAAEAFLRSLDLSRTKRRPETYYKLAFSLDETGASEKAIDYYKISALENSKLGQLSAFRLGVLFSEQSNYASAVNAFESAAASDHDAPLAQQSLFLAGKSLYASKRFEEAIFTLNSFLEKYPDSQWEQEAVELTGQAYYHTSDYDAAIVFIEKSPINSSVTRATYQSITFLKAQQLYNSASPGEAITYLTKSLRFDEDRDITSRANLLGGDTRSILGEYQNAISFYRNAAGNTGDDEVRIRATYGLAYAYFNTRKYDLALSQFEKLSGYLNRNLEMYEEVRVRVADIYFLRKSYDRAIADYKKGLSSRYADYANFQLGLVYYLKEASATAIPYFQSVIDEFPGSSYVDNALFQLGKLQFEELQFREAIRQFTKLIETYSGNPLVPYAILQRALCQTNLENYSSSERDFRVLISQYPGHPTTNDALLGLQDLMGRGHKVPDFEEVLNAVKAADPSNEGLMIIEIDFAKSRYFDQAYEAAIAKFRQVLEDYPNSDFETELRYYIGDSYNQLGDGEKALEWFDPLFENTDHPYAVRVMDKRGQILTGMGRTEDAIDNYENMMALDPGVRTRYKALDGLVRNHFAQGDHEEVLKFTEDIISGTQQPPMAVITAHLFRGKSLYHINSLEEALNELQQVATGPRDELAAEATFWIARIRYDQKEFEIARETLFELISAYSSYQQWTDEAYLLIGDTYLAEDELLQARATFNSIIERADDTNLIGRAQQKLREVRQMEEELILQKMEEDSVKTDSL